MPGLTPTVTVEPVRDRLRAADLHDLCDAADEAIRAGGGFGWVEPPPRDVMERYWKGVLVVPERMLFVGRLDGVIAGSAQLQRPPRNNEAQAHAGTLTTSFVAPWARGHGLARRLTLAVERAAREAGLRILNLDVRETQEAAIVLYEHLGFTRWGTHPYYAQVDGKPVAGHFYFKDLTSNPQPDDTPP
ncbi:GNAT family N-acetyltransferase [Azospirillum halopraeferens]|uniref:GNAT family N-acetyltransferase n=1 Tax=Azospirillum halopraeferens TaxID=34010 RepID=UPI000420FBC8|nr:GNAT family N-acetyltransferase [Azospirillum halopraeferens]